MRSSLDVVPRLIVYTETETSPQKWSFSKPSPTPDPSGPYAQEKLSPAFISQGHGGVGVQDPALGGGLCLTGHFARAQQTPSLVGREMSKKCPYFDAELVKQRLGVSRMDCPECF